VLLCETVKSDHLTPSISGFQVGLLLLPVVGLKIKKNVAEKLSFVSMKSFLDKNLSKMLKGATTLFVLTLSAAFVCSNRLDFSNTRETVITSMI